MATEILRKSPESDSASQIRSWIETALCAALATLLFWKGILPAWRVLNTDFPNYYLVARLLREGYSLDRIYDWIWLQRIKDHWGLSQSLVGFAGLTPFSALPIVPLTVFTAITAKRIWIVANLAFLAISVEYLHRSTALSRRRIWILSLLAIVPLRTGFLYGQMHILVLMLLVVAFYFHQRNSELTCGVCIALAGALKMYPLLFILYFLWKRQLRAALATVAAAGIIVVTSGLLMGHDLLHLYATQILPRSLQGEVIDPYSTTAASIASLLHRSFLFEPALNPSPLLNSPNVYAIVYPIFQLTILLPLLALLNPSAPDTRREQLEWSAFLFCLLVLSPVPSSYHFVVMILSLVLLVDFLLRRNEKTLAALAITLYLCMSIIGLVPFPAFSRLWLGIALYALFLVCLWRSRPPETAAHLPLRHAILALFAIAVLITGVLGYRHHFFHLQQEMARRIPTPPAFLLSDPRPTSDGYLYVTMSLDGFRVLDQQGHDPIQNANLRKPVDRLSFAVASDNALFVELPDDSGSRIIRASNLSTVVEDAESPTISTDDTTLAFLRERKGRGSLWTIPLGEAAANHSRPTLLSDDSYDVRGAQFLRSGALLFVAKHNGRLALFTVTPGNPPAPFFSSPTDIGSFAISPDENHIAFTQLTNNRWQLVLMDPHTLQQTALTSTDCNAYSPAWLKPTTILYATDCGRGLGLTALASIEAVR